MVIITTKSPTAKWFDSQGGGGWKRNLTDKEKAEQQQAQVSTGNKGGASSSKAQVEKVDMYAELQPSGEVSDVIYTRNEKGDFVPLREQTSEGEVSYRFTENPSLKRNIEAGEPYPVYTTASGQSLRKPENIQTETIAQQERRLLSDKQRAQQERLEAARRIYPNTISAATPEQIAAGKRARNPFYQFTRGAVIGAWQPNNPEIQSSLSEARGSDKIISPFAAGASFGVVGALALAGLFPESRAAKAAGEAAVIAKEAAVSAKPAVSAVLGSGIGRAGVELIGGGAAVYGGTKAYSELSGSSTGRGIMQSADISAQEIYGAGIKSQRKDFTSDKWYKDIAFDIPFVNYFYDEKAFNTGVNQYLGERGLSPEQREQVLKDVSGQRLGRNVIETIGLIPIASRGGERLGRFFVAEAFAKEGAETFTRKESFKTLLKAGGFIPFMKAGAVEGGLSVFVQETARGQSYAESTNIAGLKINNLILGGAAGAASAATIGGAGVLSTSLKYPKTSKVLQGLSYVTDYNEFLGDKTQDAIEALGRRAGRSFPEPKIYGEKLSGKASASDVFGFAEARAAGASRVRAPVMSNLFSNAESLTSINPLTNTRVDTFLRTQLNIFNPVPMTSQVSSINTPVNIPISSAIPVNIGLPINTNLNVNTDVNLPIEAAVPINTNLPVNINLPVLTPNAKLIPPLVPLALPLGFGGSGRAGRGSRKKYVNELALGGVLLQDIVKSDFAASAKMVNIKPKRRKKKK